MVSKLAPQYIFQKNIQILEAGLETNQRQNSNLNFFHMTFYLLTQFNSI